MKNEPSQNIVQNMLTGLANLFAALRNRLSPPKRPPELAELEARFTRDADSDPEKMKNRQFSNTMRSGRG